MHLVQVAFNLPLRREFCYSAASPVPVGVRVTADFGKRRLTGFVVDQPRTPPPGVSVRELHRVVDAQPLFDPGYLELAHWVRDVYLCSLGEALAAMVPAGRREVSLLEDPAATDPVEQPLLTGEQEAAVNALRGGPGPFYLNGVTGSGKTTVFLQAARRQLEQQRSVIYLVPEIALTHQVVALFKATFGDVVAVIHSSLTPAQRLTEWFRIQRGQATVVVGARSAVFAPVARLGLVVMDEEHEGSYKSSSTPRYHARQVALYRCRQAGAQLVMGSATPSLEACHQMRGGQVTELRLTRRVAGGAPPEIRVVDMSRQPGPLSRELNERLRATLAAGRQAILFLNRRGFAQFVQCRACDQVMECVRCAVTLTFHKASGRMECHYCGYRTAPVQVCPHCKSTDIGYSGFGTERIEEVLERQVPNARVARADADAVRGRNGLAELLQTFGRREIDILVGTQMVAKGLNFPGVRLVGVVNADTALHLPDFRAAERTFSLILQVAGRAGRFQPDGEVIVQTRQPRAAAVRLAVAADLEGFVTQELAVREELGFPPFRRLLRVVARSRSAQQAQEAAQLLADRVCQEDPGTDVLGPAACPLSRIGGRYRHHVMFRAIRMRSVHGVLERVLTTLKLPAGVTLEIDVDPVNVL